MAKQLLATDRVTLLLALIPYLDEHGPTPVEDLARAFAVDPALLRRLVRFLGTAGVPGETMSYQHEDLFDIDWDALEERDVVSLTRIVAVDGTPRFAPIETAALIAGLQALTAVLPDDEAELARATADKLGAALNEPGADPAVSVAVEPADPALPTLIRAIERDAAVSFEYLSIQGRQTSRTVDPIALSEENGTWYLRGYCRDRAEQRTFRADRMSRIRESGERRSVPPEDAQSKERAVFELTLSLPQERLGLISGFEPEILEECADGRVMVRVEAWHEGSAVRILQESRGAAVIEGPESARTAAREWAQRALSAYDA